jgi:hypothetical protein
MQKKVNGSFAMAAWHQVPKSREAKDATLDWLLRYTGSRMHSLSPTQFEQQAIAQLALAV